MIEREMIHTLNAAGRILLETGSVSDGNENVESQFWPVAGFIALLVAAACCGAHCCDGNGRGHQVHP